MNPVIPALQAALPGAYIRPTRRGAIAEWGIFSLEVSYLGAGHDFILRAVGHNGARVNLMHHYEPDSVDIFVGVSSALGAHVEAVMSAKVRPA